MFNCYNNELTHDAEGKSIWGYYIMVYRMQLNRCFMITIPTYLVIIGLI